MASEDDWDCTGCGANNSVLATECFVCERPAAPRPPAVPSTATAPTVPSTATVPAVPSAPPTVHRAVSVSDDWLCDVCKCINSGLASDCFICEAPRGATGAAGGGDGAGAGAGGRSAVPDPSPDTKDLPADLPPDFFIPTEAETKSWQRLSPGQQAIMQAVTFRAKQESDAAMPKLVERAVGLGFSKLDVIKTLKHVRDKAPIVVHVNLGKMIPFFQKDWAYRSLFETQTSGGAKNTDMRTRKEDRLFLSYSGLDHKRRVKYGVLNITNDPRGVTACKNYGSSYFRLHGVRLRTTFCDRNSGNADTKCGTAEYYAHFMLAYSDGDLTNALRVGSGQSVWADSALTNGRYKEVQIHGMLEFAHDIGEVVVSVKDREACGDLPILKWAAKNGITVIWEGELPPADVDMMSGVWDIVPPDPAVLLMSPDKKAPAVVALGAAAGAGGQVIDDDPGPPPPKPFYHPRTLEGKNDQPDYHAAYVPSPLVPPAPHDPSKKG